MTILFFLAKLLLYGTCSVIVMSIVEYMVHRWLMHQPEMSRRFPFLRRVLVGHTSLHHGRFYKQFVNDPDPAAKYVNIEFDIFENLLWLSPFYILLYFIDPVASITFVVAIILHGLVWAKLHTEMHEPTKGWLSRLSYFRYLRDYHYTHHLHPTKNFNAVLPPLGDWLFGTYLKPVRFS